MEFKIHFPIRPSEIKLKPTDSIFLTGSCFSDHIGNFLHDYKFNVRCNPNGNVFNPISIFSTLKGVALNESITESDLFESEDLWFSRQCNSKIFGETRKELAEKLKSLQDESFHFLSKCSCLFITLGTAFVYELKGMKAPLANCHRLPASLFDKRLLSVTEIENSFSQFYKALDTLPSRPQIVITVSPVKHLKDGVVENNLSKSTLLLAVNGIRSRFSDVGYFPAFEIVNDELRDYRFYNGDFAHPNQSAIDYVTERFTETYLSEDAKKFISEYSEIKAAMKHRVQQGNSAKHRSFLRTFYEKTIALKVQYSFADFTQELDYFAANTSVR